MAIRAGEIVFLDTNVLLVATDESRAHPHEANALFAAAGPGGYHLALSGQLLREYLVVATRTIQDNGLGLSVDQALGNVAAFVRRTVFYAENEAVAARLRSLCAERVLSGKRIHEANVVATLLAHGLSSLVTENTADFDGFPEIKTIGLEALAPAPGGAPAGRECCAGP